MDPHLILAKLETPEECEQFAINVVQKYPDVARKAKRRAVEIRAELKGAESVLERELLEAVYAYETVQSERRGKKVPATRTWQMIKRHGIVGAAVRAVDRADDTAGYRALASMGMQDLSFEAIILRYSHSFEEKVVKRCRDRLVRYNQDSAD